jgi:hypothetical protein
MQVNGQVHERALGSALHEPGRSGEVDTIMHNLIEIEGAVPLPFVNAQEIAQITYDNPRLLNPL